MIKKATVYTPDRGNEGVSYRVGFNDVSNISFYNGSVLEIYFKDGSVTVFINMPFEYSEIPEEVN